MLQLKRWSIFPFLQFFVLGILIVRGTVLRYLRHQVRPQVHHQLLRFAGTEATKIPILAALRLGFAMRVMTKQNTTTVPLPRTPASSAVVIAMALLVVLNIVLVWPWERTWIGRFAQIFSLPIPLAAKLPTWKLLAQPPVFIVGALPNSIDILRGMRVMTIQITTPLPMPRTPASSAVVVAMALLENLLVVIPLIIGRFAKDGFFSRSIAKFPTWKFLAHEQLPILSKKQGCKQGSFIVKSCTFTSQFCSCVYSTQPTPSYPP